MTWIRKKYYENKVMLAFYKTAATLLREQDEIISLLTRLYTVLKDTPVEELKNQFIVELANIVHDSAEQERKEKS